MATQTEDEYRIQQRLNALIKAVTEIRGNDDICDCLMYQNSWEMGIRKEICYQCKHYCRIAKLPTTLFVCKKHISK
jgi:hypothetical protein